MVQCCFTSTETVRLIRTGSPGRPPRLSHSFRTLNIGAREETEFIPAVEGRWVENLPEVEGRGWIGGELT